MKIVFATNNQHKLQEIRDILGSDYEVVSLKEIGCDVDIPVNRQPMMSDMKSCPSPNICTILPSSPIIQSCARARNRESMMMA